MDFTYSGVLPGISPANAPNAPAKSYTMTAEIELPQGGGKVVATRLLGVLAGVALHAFVARGLLILRKT
jgi:arylsulfatase